MQNATPFVLASPNGLRTRITQELNELCAISAMIDSRLENIDHTHIIIPPPFPLEQLFNDFMNLPDVFEMDDLEDSESTASIIFLDFPVGTGFSYAKTTHGSHTTDLQSSDQAYEFMIKWLGNHPQFIPNEFYVGGDSYSGNPVPIITQLISDGNGAGIEPCINLKGYVLGNPSTFPEEFNYHIRFANGMGLISDELYKSLLHSCGGEYRQDYINPNNVGCVQNMELYLECMDGIQPDDILEPYCGDPRLQIKLPTQKQYKAGGRPVSACEIDVKDLAHYWADDASVRKALHIRE
ncbi:serine carboxypeptidase-like protein 13 isoform X1, partial [Tanacetum coccineum]